MTVKTMSLHKFTYNHANFNEHTCGSSGGTEVSYMCENHCQVCKKMFFFPLNDKSQWKCIITGEELIRN